MNFLEYTEGIKIMETWRDPMEEDLEESLKEALEENASLKKENKQLRDNICRAVLFECDNKQYKDSKYCRHHKCKYKKCLDSKTYNRFYILIDHYCLAHKHFWNRF